MKSMNNKNSKKLVYIKFTITVKNPFNQRYSNNFDKQ